MKKRGMFRKRKFSLFLLFFCPFLLSLVSAVSTELNISITDPYLLSQIPNQTWQVNSSLYGAFDLDDYFFDDQDFPLTYWSSVADNITIIIDSENVVSFFSDINFVGQRTILFYASNGFLNSSSNLVYLNVGTDFESPKWYKPKLDKTPIYQNTLVNFTSNWTDNAWLKKYLFSINEGGGWVNLSETNFSGTANTSLSSVQISAPGGTVVFWSFYAWDTSFNINSTDIQNFTVLSRQIPPMDAGGGGGGISKAISKIFSKTNVSNFSVSPDIFKIFLRKNESKTVLLRIMNIGTTNMSFNIYEQNLKNLVILETEEVLILPGETKKITIDFISNKLGVEQYFGYLVVNSSYGYKKVPAIIDIKDEISKFDLNVTVPNKNVRPNEKITANIEVLNSYNLNVKRGNLTYSIKDMNGNIYDTFEEEIDFSQDTLFEKTLSLPKNSPEGEYLFYARLVSSNLVAIDSDSFKVGFLDFYFSFIKPFFLILLIILLAIIFATLMIGYKRYKDREKTLNLYFMLMNLKRLIEEEKLDEALELYILIKSRYNEKVPKSTIENREELKKEIKSLLSNLKKQMPKEVDEKVQKEEQNQNEKRKNEEGGLKKEQKQTIQKSKSEKKVLKEEENSSEEKQDKDEEISKTDESGGEEK